MVLECWSLFLNDNCDPGAKIHYAVYNRLGLLLKSLIQEKIMILKLINFFNLYLVFIIHFETLGRQDGPRVLESSS